jgi:hypothetical protein
MATVKENKVILYNGIQANLVQGTFYRDNHPLVIEKPELFIIEKIESKGLELLIEEPVKVETVIETVEADVVEVTEEPVKEVFTRKQRRR